MLKQIKPLSIETVLQDPLYKFDYSADYTEEISIDTPDVETYTTPNQYLRYLVNKLSTNISEYRLKYNKVNIAHNNLDAFCTKSKYITVTLLKSDLPTFSNLILTDSEDLEYLLQHQLQEIYYFGNTDTLVLPTCIHEYLQNNSYLKCSILAYDLHLSTNKLLKTYSVPFDIPTLKFSCLSNTAYYPTFKERYYLDIPTPKGIDYIDCYALYTNLPKELYTNIIFENKTLHYNITNKQFYGAEGINETNLALCCKHLSENPLDRVIVLRLTKDGHFIPLWSTKQLLASLYIGYPKIPVCILSEQYHLPTSFISKKNDIDIEKTKDFLKPYFMLND